MGLFLSPLGIDMQSFVLRWCSLLSVLAFMSLWSGISVAADYSDGDSHKNDFKWLQFNLMQSKDNRLPYGNREDAYFEMEFGGRSGIMQLYGYLDVFDIFDDPTDDLHDGDNFFFKFAPRFSLDGMFGKDLSYGPIKELYISTLTNVGDRGHTCINTDGSCNEFGSSSSGLFEHYLGFGMDVEVPWLGLVGANLMARYSRENFGIKEKKWDGYIFTTNWFKPFYFFENKTFISYQGYFDYKFKVDELAKVSGRSSNALEWFNGFYWHSDRWALGYGLKIYNNMALFKDGAPYGTKKQNTSGPGQYFSATYKF